VLLVPKLLSLRRDRRSWFAFRVLLAIAGAALVILPLSLWNNWSAGIGGLAMFSPPSCFPPPSRTPRSPIPPHASAPR